MKGGVIFDFQKGGNLRKGGGGMTPLTNYGHLCNSIIRIGTYFDHTQAIKLQKFVAKSLICTCDLSHF